MNVVETWQLAEPPASPSRIAVVIDVLRWTTVAITALANGASRIEAVATPEQALQRAKALNPASRILGGERNSRKLKGFDLGNSPSEYAPHRVHDKVVITTTTNGTQAVLAAEGSEDVLLAAFLNLPAVCAHLAARGAEITLLCAGQAGAPALEDSGCAGAIVAALVMQGAVCVDTLDPSALAALAVWDAHGRSPGRLFAAAPHGQALVREGFAEDLTAAAQVGAVDLIPRVGVQVLAYR